MGGKKFWSRLDRIAGNPTLMFLNINVYLKLNYGVKILKIVNPLFITTQTIPPIIHANPV